MSKEFKDDLNTQERQAFDRLTREEMPPSFLEERIVEALKGSNLIRSPRRGWRLSYSQIGVALAGSLAVFVLGAIVGTRWVSGSSQKPGMPEFMLVLRASAQESQERSSEEVRKSVEEYSAWAREIRKTGLLVGGEKLKEQARLLRMADGRASVSENFPGPTESLIEGYFLIQATDYQHAVAIAAGCPHLKYGGTVEIRQIDQF
ncbi:MAG: YciI family protein [Blastocatellia bacterium]